MRTLLTNFRRQIIYQVPGKDWPVEHFMSRFPGELRNRLFLEIKMNLYLKAMLFAVPFAVAYFVMWSLLVTPCDFLHEETYNAEGIVDYCGEEFGFRGSLPANGLVFRFSPAWRIGPWQALRVLSVITQFDGSPLTSDEVAPVIQKIHLLAVDESLSDYYARTLNPTLSMGVFGTFLLLLKGPVNTLSFLILFLSVVPGGFFDLFF